ncbi:TlpA disulfide reductase family protein [Microvirga sp. VF16]|uniref:TlpA family protein disulfide reductase n=1 Tax=Microvirga sp. VF16 TaxID=2807101 RepID=UPI00193E1569|nr:TlpA disulfide reductase family protein [Microvirga sp. VF16]QRM35258.1 TlpA family protein disulfide reductase [Microvirga sp. VF16]
MSVRAQAKLILVIMAFVAGLVSTPVPANELPERLQLYAKPRPVPAITFKGPQGEDLTLASFRGKFVVLNIWATWCVPCRKEMPTLDRLQGLFNNDDVAVVALSLDRQGREVVDKFFRDIGVEHLVPYVDSSGQALRDLGLVGLPGTLLIDRDGLEIGRLLGEADWSGQAMVEFIKAKANAPVQP